MHSPHYLLRMMRALLLVLGLAYGSASMAQQHKSMYGDQVKADVKLNYVYSLEEAMRRAKSENKLIFFNCFADWAIPCHGMNQYVFSDSAFGQYMNNTFVNLFVDVSKRTPEAEALVKRYSIQYFAHYLVLDANGEIVHRIVGGKRLPDFKDDLMLALSPKTSLAGTTATYASGKYGKRELLSHIKALRLAGYEEQYQKVAQEYWKMLKPKEYTAKEQWPVLTSFIKQPEGEYYDLLIRQKAGFEKVQGTQLVNTFIESLFTPTYMSYITGNTHYDAAKVLSLFMTLQQASLPDTSVCYELHRLTKLRGEKQYSEFITGVQALAPRLGYTRSTVFFSLDLPEMSEAVRQQAVAAIRAEAEVATGSQAKQLLTFANRLERPEGIKFHTGSLAEATAQAKREGKLLFIDCYTTWCGPCKMMSNNVFPQPEMGQAFNPYFVSMKIDMEKGEGIELAKRWEVTAFPTMLVLTPEGEVLHRIVGARQGPELIKEIEPFRRKDTHTASVGHE